MEYFVPFFGNKGVGGDICVVCSRRRHRKFEIRWLGGGRGVLLQNGFFSICRSMMRAVSHFFPRGSHNYLYGTFVTFKDVASSANAAKGGKCLPRSSSAAIINFESCGGGGGGCGRHICAFNFVGQEGGRGILRHMLPSLSLSSSFSSHPLRDEINALFLHFPHF